MLRKGLIGVFILLTSGGQLLSAQPAQNAGDSLVSLLRQELADSSRVSVLLQLARLSRNQQPDSTIALAKQALSLAVTLQDSGRQATALRIIGAGFYFKGDYRQAARWEAHALAIFRARRDSLQIAMSENNIGSNFLNLGQYDSALLHLEAARYQFRLNQDSARELYVMNNLAIIQIRQANYAQAMQTLLKALELAKRYKDDRNRLLILNNIGVVHEKQEDWQQALTVNLKLLKEYQAVNNRVQEALTYSNLGVIYFQLKRIEPARIALDKAIALFSQLGHEDGIAQAKNNLGSQLSQQNNPELALPLLKDAYQYYSRVNSKSGRLAVALSLGRAHLAMQQYWHSEKYAREALGIYQENGEAKSAPELYDLLHQLYAARGNYQQAYYYHQQYKQLQDSLFSLDREKEINRLSYLYQLQENESLIRADSLQKNQLVTQRALRERSELILAWITLAALLLAGLVLVYVMKDKKLRQAYRQLRGQNLEIVKNREDIREQARQLQEAYEEIRQINENLEVMVRSRTEELENKNRQLEEYAFLNAHKLRAPVARLMGLIHIAGLAKDQAEVHELMMLSQQQAREVDRIVKKIGKAIQDGLPLDRWAVNN